MNWYELAIKNNKWNKPEWQDCEVVVKTVDDKLSPLDVKNETVGYYQACTIEGVGGQGTIPASFYFHGSVAPSNKIDSANLNLPMAVQCKVAPDNSQYSVGGKKYTLKVVPGSPASSGGNAPAGGQAQAGAGSTYAAQSLTDEILGKCECNFVDATLASGKYTPAELWKDKDALACIACLAEWCMRKRD